MGLRPQLFGGDYRDAGGIGSHEAETRPWLFERWFLASAVFVILIVALLTFVLRGDKHGTAPSGPAIHVTQLPTALPVPTAAPGGTTWNLWYGIALPSLPNDPATINDDVPSGFAHTPEGALIAASQLSYRCLMGAHWHDVADKYITGPGRDTFITHVASLGNPTDTSGVAQLAGFRFITYTPDQASIELVNGSTPSYKVGTVSVMWTDNDWRVVTQPNGAPATPTLPLTNLAGYSPWTGVAR